MSDLIRPSDLQKVAAEKEMARAREIAEAEQRRADERHQLQQAFMDRQLHPDVAGRDDLAVADHDHAVPDRLRPIAQGDGAAGDGDGLGTKRSGGREQQRGGETADHFVSPSPGWPSSKSLTGRRLGSFMSYISAPSTHTRSGRV